MDINATPDDILIRPYFLPDGTLEGYFANDATEIAEKPFVSGEVQPTPQAALEKYLAEQWPEHGATAFAWRWIANRPGGYNGVNDFYALVAILDERFPGMGCNAESIVRRCEIDGAKQATKERAVEHHWHVRLPPMSTQIRDLG